MTTVSSSQRANLAKTASFRINVTVEPDSAPAEQWDGAGIAGLLVKSDSERRYTLCIAYPANKADVTVARDGHRDFAGKRAVREAAWAYLEKSPLVGAWHENGTEGTGRVVESFIWPDDASDWHMKAVDGSEQVVKSGDWLVGIRWDESAWQLIKEGRASGVSMQGAAKRRKPDAASVAQLRT